MIVSVAFLAPTFSYTVYSQFQKKGRQALIMERSLAWGALPQAPDGHPDYGVSPYNLHSDGSGVVMSFVREEPGEHAWVIYDVENIPADAVTVP